MPVTETLRCFLVTPYSKEFSSLRRLLVDGLRENGIEPTLAEEMEPSIRKLSINVQQAIERADFIIADLTESNPNVMYEIGFAHGLRKPVIFIVQRRVRHVPSSISSYLYFVYDPSKPEELLRNIRDWITRNLSEGNRMARK